MAITPEQAWEGLNPPYATIVADPPWEYEEGFPQGTMPGGGRGTVALPYSSASLDALAALPVADLAAPTGAWLFLWTTNKYLPASFGLIREWGFRYTQAITWRKTGAPHPFVRSVAPQHSEHLIVSRRGRAQRLLAFPSSVIDAPAQRIHSLKPGVFADLIEQACPGPYVELFARQPRLGWDAWGWGVESVRQAM